jgi:DNA repair protein RadC
MAQRVSSSIKDLPIQERPRERLARVGEGALSTTELVAIILRVGVGGESALDMARRLLTTYDGLPGLARASFAELRAERGLGKAKTAQLKAALELGRRMLLATPEDRLVVRSPSDVAQILIAEMAHLEQENFQVLYLDTRNRLLGSERVYVGTLNASHIRVAEIFRDAVKRNCAAIIVAHNHPSGDPSPSPEDVEVTRQLIAAGKLLSIELLDHLIIGQQRFVSLRERGLGFEE